MGLSYARRVIALHVRSVASSLQRRALFCLSFALCSAMVIPARADFDPAGRKSTSRPGGRRPTVQQPTKGGARRRGEAQDVEALIARYTRVVLERPGEVFPLRRLVDLYRQRDGSTEKLVTMLENQSDARAWAGRVALAGLHRIENRNEQARRSYEAALAEKPNVLTVQQAYAQLLFDMGDVSGARAAFDKALVNAKDRVDQESVLRTLITIALDQSDQGAAREYHRRLVALVPASIVVRGELARQWVQREQYALAEAEYRSLLRGVVGDSRVLSPLLRDLGHVLLKQNKNEEAIGVLRRAIEASGPAVGLRREISGMLVQAYRAQGKLDELVKELDGPGKQRDYESLTLLGSLLEETGQVERAVRTYEKVLASNPRDTDVRLRLIRLYNMQGALTEAIQHYEALTRLNPHNIDYAFELCELLLQQGELTKALQVLTRFERQAKDNEVKSRLADFYDRINETERAAKLRKALTRTALADDPQHIIDLGSALFAQGEKEKAMETWLRLRTVMQDAMQFHLAMAETLRIHGRYSEARHYMEEATRAAPKTLGALRTLALAWERAWQGNRGSRRSSSPVSQAERLWNEVLELAVAKGDKAAIREARSHLITSWVLSRRLEQQVGYLRARFNRNPPDLEAGKLLAEVELRMRSFQQAEDTLNKLLKVLPGDVDMHLTLERLYLVQQRKDKAIEVLERLATIDAKAARQYYQRMAQYATELYKDKDAIAYASRAVALSPEDAVGHRNLGQLYRKSNDVARAIAEYRTALTQNPRLYVASFELAELLLSQGQLEEADSLYRVVMRTCPDSELVARSARLSMQIHLGRGTLRELEKDLLPIALGSTHGLVYRRVLLDLYSAMTFPLIERVRFGSADQAAKAKKELQDIGARAVRPLLDALRSQHESEQHTAIEVLRYVANRAAAGALFSYAVGTAPLPLRIQAMLACGALQDEQLAPRYYEILNPSANQAVPAPVALAAVWGLSQLVNSDAKKLMRELASSGHSDVRAFALLAVAATRDPQAEELLARVIEQDGADVVSTAAAALGLASMKATRYGARVTGLLAGGADPWLHTMLMVAAAQLDSSGAELWVARSLFDDEPFVRHSAVAALVSLSTKRGVQLDALWKVSADTVDMREILSAIAFSDPSPSHRAKAFTSFEQLITKTAKASIEQSVESAKFVADALTGCEDAYCFSPVTDGLWSGDSTAFPLVRQAAKRVTEQLAVYYRTAVKDSDAALRLKAVQVLARDATAASRALLISLLSTDDERLRRAVIGHVGAWKEGRVHLVELLSTSPDWAVRLQIVEVLGSVGKNLPGSETQAIARALSKPLAHDPYLLVRHAAFRVLRSFDRADVQDVIRSAAQAEPDGSLRQAMGDWLGGSKSVPKQR